MKTPISLQERQGKFLKYLLETQILSEKTKEKIRIALSTGTYYEGGMHQQKFNELRGLYTDDYKYYLTALKNFENAGLL